MPAEIIIVISLCALKPVRRSDHLHAISNIVACDGILLSPR
jgi:hypothetical protein